MPRYDPDKVQELQKLLDQSVIKPEEARQMYNTWTEQWEDERMSKGIPHQIAPSSAYHSSSDAQNRCPHCYNCGQHEKLGTLVIDGAPRPAYKCPSCNKVYADLPAAIKTIADELVKQGYEKVGFQPHDGNSSSQAPLSGHSYQLDQTNQKLDQVTSCLNNLNITIINLMERVNSLADQNNRLMEQLATDPLISVRKAVTEFNLK